MPPTQHLPSALGRAVGTGAARWDRGPPVDGATLRDRVRPATAAEGRLVGPGGAPSGGATIDLVATPSAVGGAPIAMSSPRTRPDGRFSVRLPAGVGSRRLCFAYRPGGGASVPVATRTLT